MSRRRKILLTALSLLLLAAALVAWVMILPKPQSSFTSLEPAPDFTLNDQDGKPFTLSSLRGSRVVLVFYRGYW
jgi:cytochrome oxidase Cu insertion factor (SCO1/SenC/PrrC family)